MSLCQFLPQAREQIEQKCNANAKNFQFYVEFEIRGSTVAPKRSANDNKAENGKKRKQSEENTGTVGDSGGDFSLLVIKFVD